MTALQIVLLSVIGAVSVASIVFMVMFIVEICFAKKEKVEEEKEVPTVFVLQTLENENNEKEENDVESMIASIEEQTKDEEIVEEIREEVVEAAEEPVEEVVEEPVEEAAEEPVEEVVVENVAEEAVEETVEEVKEEIQEESIENLASLDETAEDDVADDEDTEILSNIEELKADETAVVAGGTVLDYKARLDKIIETRNKIERDLTKIQKSILKYERTKRRKNRNQKMLDKRAGELTNLNLVMYSVTDIKNVDEDKKVKQEELTAHIAELKASIQDADEFIESNKEKNEHNVKMAKFLMQEKARYNEEIAELQALINKNED